MVRVFNDVEQDEVFLRLVDAGDGSVDLVCVDYDGEPESGGFLLNINGSRVMLYCGIDPEFGFALDDEGSLLVEGEFE